MAWHAYVCSPVGERGRSRSCFLASGDVNRVTSSQDKPSRGGKWGALCLTLPPCHLHRVTRFPPFAKSHWLVCLWGKGVARDPASCFMGLWRWAWGMAVVLESEVGTGLFWLWGAISGEEFSDCHGKKGSFFHVTRCCSYGRRTNAPSSPRSVASMPTNVAPSLARSLKCVDRRPQTTTRLQSPVQHLDAVMWQMRTEPQHEDKRRVC